MVQVCCVSKCQNNSNWTTQVSYHKFPKDPIIRNAWSEFTERGSEFQPTPASRICSQHFTKSCFARQFDASVDKWGEHRRVLLRTAVPTIKCNPDGSFPEVEDDDLSDPRSLSIANIEKMALQLSQLAQIANQSSGNESEINLPEALTNNTTLAQLWSSITSHPPTSAMSSQSSTAASDDNDSAAGTIDDHASSRHSTPPPRAAAVTPPVHKSHNDNSAAAALTTPVKVKKEVPVSAPSPLPSKNLPVASAVSTVAPSGIKLPSGLSISPAVSDAAVATTTKGSSTSAAVDNKALNQQLQVLLARQGATATLLPSAAQNGNLNGGDATPRRRGRGKERTWHRVCTFDNEDQAKKHICNEKTWILQKKTDVREGQKVYYECTRYRQYKCPAAVLLLYHAGAEQVSLFRAANSVHNHDLPSPQRSKSSTIPAHQQTPSSVPGVAASRGASPSHSRAPLPAKVPLPLAGPGYTRLPSTNQRASSSLLSNSSANHRVGFTSAAAALANQRAAAAAASFSVTASQRAAFTQAAQQLANQQRLLQAQQQLHQQLLNGGSAAGLTAAANAAAAAAGLVDPKQQLMLASLRSKGISNVTLRQLRDHLVKSQMNRSYPIDLNSDEEGNDADDEMRIASPTTKMAAANVNGRLPHSATGGSTSPATTTNTHSSSSSKSASTKGGVALSSSSSLDTKKKKRSCFVDDCRDYAKSGGPRLLPFPPDIQRRLHWSLNINLRGADGSLKIASAVDMLCASHFDVNRFDPDTRDLLPDAVPTLNLGGGISNRSTTVVTTSSSSYSSLPKQENHPSTTASSSEDRLGLAAGKKERNSGSSTIKDENIGESVKTTASSVSATSRSAADNNHASNNNNNGVSQSAERVCSPAGGHAPKATDEREAQWRKQRDRDQREIFVLQQRVHRVRGLLDLERQLRLRREQQIDRLKRDRQQLFFRVGILRRKLYTAVMVKPKLPNGSIVKRKTPPPSSPVEEEPPSKRIKVFEPPSDPTEGLLDVFQDEPEPVQEMSSSGSSSGSSSSGSESDEEEEEEEQAQDPPVSDSELAAALDTICD